MFPTTMTELEWAAACFFVAGTFFVCIGCLGVFRLPDIFCRAHALTKSMTFGMMLLLLGTWLAFFPVSDAKLFVVWLFQFTTIPLSGHFMGMIAFRKNVPRWRHQPAHFVETE